MTNLMTFITMNSAGCGCNLDTLYMVLLELHVTLYVVVRIMKKHPDPEANALYFRKTKI